MKLFGNGLRHDNTIKRIAVMERQLILNDGMLKIYRQDFDVIPDHIVDNAGLFAVYLQLAERGFDRDFP